jgi:hypothetical protein
MRYTGCARRFPEMLSDMMMRVHVDVGVASEGECLVCVYPLFCGRLMCRLGVNGRGSVAATSSACKAPCYDGFGEF